MLTDDSTSWPSESTELREHRITFFSQFGVSLDDDSNATFEQQLRANENSNPFVYSFDFLPLETHEHYIRLLQQKKENPELTKSSPPPHQKLLRDICRTFELSDETDEDGNPVLLRKAGRMNRQRVEETRRLMVLHSKAVFDTLKSVHYDVTTHGDVPQIMCQFEALEIYMTPEVARKFVSTCQFCEQQRATFLPDM
jgi:hypothetical protein